MLIMHRYAILLVLFITIILANPSYAGNPKRKDIKKAERLIENQNFDEATVILRKALKENPKHVELNFMMGVCYYHNNCCSPKTMEYLEKALESAKKRKIIVEIKHYLGKAYHANKKFDKAIKTYKSLLVEIHHKNYKLKREVKRLIETSQYARHMVENPVNIRITSLGKKINSEYTEHSPSVSADEKLLVFTSRRGTEGEKKDVDGQYFEDIYMAKNDGKSWAASQKIKELSSMGHDASVSISPDGRTMLLYRANINSRTAVAGDIYMSKRTGDKWSKPEKLKGGINTPYKESHASFSKDGNTIYFTSNRPGGKGGMDIYMSTKDKEGKWQRARNLGDIINTEYDEIGPYIHPDGKTIYFSSKGHKTIGGFDIFLSELSEGNWSPPENMGYPVNSLLDDIYYTPTVDGKRAYFASARKGGQGKMDIYHMDIHDYAAKKIFVIRGKIGEPSKDESYDDYRIIVNTKDGKEGLYSPDPLTGEYLYIISADKEYEIEFARKGYQTMYTKVMIPFDYYNDVNRGIINFNQIKLLTYKGGYTAPDLSINLYKLGFPVKNAMLPVINDKKAMLVIKNLGVKRRLLEQPPMGVNNSGAEGLNAGATGNAANGAANAVSAATGASIDGPQTFYAVQVKAMHKNLSLKYFAKRDLKVIMIMGKDGLHKYFFGKFNTPKEAGKVLRRIRKSKVPDAFVRHIIDGKVGEIVPRRLWR